MILSTFFEKFDQFAGAPDAVSKMRELVLQLAVTGKLVAQDKRDDPASSLLKSARAERERLVAARKIRPRPTTPVEVDEQPFTLPSGWEWARLSDVGYELGQKVPDKPFTYIDVGGIDSDMGCISGRVEKLEPGDAPSRARKLVARGTVIYSTVRPYLRNIAIVDQDFDPEPIASTAFGILHPFDGVDSRYLFFWLRSAPFTAYVQASMKGMAYPAINDEAFYNGYIALPPLADQKRIVAKLDELMELCDRLEAQQRERETRRATLAHASLVRFADAPTPANLRFLFHPSYDITPADLRKSILTLAVQGLLVPHDAESAGWEKRQLRDLATKIGSGSTPSGGKESYHETGVPLIRSMNVHFGGFVRDGLVFLNDEQAEKLKSVTVKADDVLLNITGASIGRVATAPKDMDGARVNQHVCIIRPTAEIIAPFLELFLASPVVQRLIDDVQVGATRQALTKAMIEAFEVPVPSLSEQRRIVAKVEQLMALVDGLEAQVAASNSVGTALTAAIVGELASIG